jgi:regulation of enolase protein 1 (concanavalin A-like superfamily)
MLNSTLVAAAAKVMSNPAPAQFIVTAQFVNSQSGSEFSFFPRFIDEMVIVRDYLENFADEFDMKMTVSPKDYALLQDQGQNLLCVLTWTYVDQWGKTIYDPAPIRTQYNVMINDPWDIRKSVTDVQVHTEPNTELWVRLVEPAVYKIRQTKVNAVYQNMTMTQTLYAVSQLLGIEKIHLVPLDNTHQYDHVNITSYQGISSVYGYLHSRFGLYLKGATSYLSGGVLYVYPPFETDPVYDKTAIFYQVDSGKYAGAHIFHRTENKNVSVVVNTQPQSYDLSVGGSENIGTGFIFTRASRLTDAFTAVDSSEGARFTDEPALSVSLNSSRTLVKDYNNLTHIPSTDNPYPATSKIISHQASIMNVVWMHADPFLLDPGQKIVYYYDKDEIMVKKTGILERAEYRISRMHQMDAKSMFGVVATLTLRLSPNESVVI